MNMTVVSKSTRRPSSNPLKFNFRTSIVDVLLCKRSDLPSNTINVSSERFATLRPKSKRRWKLASLRWKTRKSKPWKKVTMLVSPSEKSNFDAVFVHALSSNFATDSNTVRLAFVLNTIDVVSVLRKTLPNSCNKNSKFNFVKRRMILKSACVRT